MNKAIPDHEGRSGQLTRNIFFGDPLFEEFALRPLIIDGCPLGEISATTSLIEEGDRDGWYLQWTATAERVAGYADESVHAGHTISARDAYLRASSYYRAAYLPLYDSPVDPRLVEAFDKETDTFQKAAALMTPPVEPVEIPYEGISLPGYFCQADDSGRPRPTLIVTNGYDSTINELYLDFTAVLPRGYNLLLYDGPGQGRVLIKQGLIMRPDWEKVVKPVVDYALTRTEVDPEKIAIMGISLGGYLALRGEQRAAPGRVHRRPRLVGYARSDEGTLLSPPERRAGEVPQRRSGGVGAVRGAHPGDPRASLEHYPASVLGARRRLPVRVLAHRRGLQPQGGG